MNTILLSVLGCGVIVLAVALLCIVSAYRAIVRLLERKIDSIYLTRHDIEAHRYIQLNWLKVNEKAEIVMTDQELDGSEKARKWVKRELAFAVANHLVDKEYFQVIRVRHTYEPISTLRLRFEVLIPKNNAENYNDVHYMGATIL